MKYSYFLAPLVLNIVAPALAADKEIQLTNPDDLLFTEKDGLETVYLKDGSPFSGAVRKKDKEGRTITYFYRNGLRNGVIMANFEDGKLEFEVTYHKGVKNGEEIYFYENGNPKFKKTYKNNVLDGEEVLFYMNGKPKVQNYYLDGKLDGETIYFDENGNQIKIEHYKAGVKNGVERIIADNILAEEINYIDGVPDGISKKYNKDYQTDEIIYKNGKKNGISKHFNTDGSIIEMPYKDDLRSGVGIAYYPDQKIANRAEYWNDEKNGVSESFYKNGRHKLIETYKNGKLEGVSRLFDKDGALQSVHYYVDGMDLAAVNIEQDADLQNIAAANRLGQISKYVSKKNYWYQILWFALNTEDTELLRSLEKNMKMYGAELDDLAVYRRESKTRFAEYNRRLFFGLTPLSYAVDLDAPVEILQNFATSGQINTQNPRGGTALQEAVRLNNLELVKFLLLHNSDVKNPQNINIFVQAVMENVRIDILEELLKNGADAEAAAKNGKTAAVYAVEKNDVVLLELLKKYQVDLQAVQPDGKNLLFYAVTQKCRPEVIDILLAAKLDVNQKDKNDNFLLLEALKSKDTALVEKLLQNGADVNMADANGESAVSYVLENPVDEYTVQKILSDKVDYSKLFGKKRQTLWQLAAEAKKYDLLKQIFDKTGGVDKPDAKNVIPLQTLLSEQENAAPELESLMLSYVTPEWLNQHNDYLQQVLALKNLAMWQKLISIGFNPDIKDKKGAEFVLQLVQKHYELPWLEELEKLNPNLNITDSTGKTLLQYAIDDNNVELAENLLEHGVAVNVVNSNYLAELKYNQPEITALLLAHGADTSYITASGQTLLMAAVQNLNVTLVEYLLKNGADVSMRDKDGNTMLFYVAEALKNRQNLAEDELLAGIKRIMELFAQNGVDVNVQNGNGETLLISLAKEKSPYYSQLLQILTEQGLDAGLKDQYGKTAADYFQK